MSSLFVFDLSYMRLIVYVFSLILFIFSTLTCVQSDLLYIQSTYIYSSFILYLIQSHLIFIRAINGYLVSSSRKTPPENYSPENCPPEKCPLVKLIETKRILNLPATCNICKNRLIHRRCLSGYCVKYQGQNT